MAKSTVKKSLASTNALIPKTDFSAERRELETIKAIRVTSDTKLEEARSTLTNIKAFIKKINDTFDPIIKAINASAKEARSQKTTTAAPFETAKSNIESEIRTYLERKEAETAAKIEAERLRLEELTTSPVANDPEASREILKSTRRLSTLDERSSARTSGTRKYYSASVDDFLALVKAVASSKVPIDALLPNTVYLNQIATSSKESFSIPGCSLTTKTSLIG